MTEQNENLLNKFVLAENEKRLNMLEGMIVKKIQDVVIENYNISFNDIEKLEFVRRGTDKNSETYEPVFKMSYNTNGIKKEIFIKINEKDKLNPITTLVMLEMGVLGYNIPKFQYFSDINIYNMYDMLITENAKELEDLNNFKEKTETTEITENEAIDRIILQLKLGINDNKTANTVVFEKYNGKNKEIFFDPTHDCELFAGNFIHFMRVGFNDSLEKMNKKNSIKEKSVDVWKKADKQQFKILKENNNNSFETHLFKLFVDFLKEQAKENVTIKTELENIDELTLSRLTEILKQLQIISDENIFCENKNKEFLDFLLRQKYPDINNKEEREKKHFNKIVYYLNKNKDRFLNIYYNYWKSNLEFKNDELKKFYNIDGYDLIKQELTNNCSMRIFLNQNVKEKYHENFFDSLSIIKYLLQFSQQNSEQNINTTYHPLFIGNNVDEEHKQQERQYFNFKNTNTALDFNFENGILKVEQLNREKREIAEDYYFSINKEIFFGSNIDNFKHIFRNKDIGTNFSNDIDEIKKQYRENEEKNNRLIIQNVIINSIITLANSLELTIEDTSRIILASIDNKDYSNIQGNNDKKGKMFSVKFQQIMSVLGIYTGRRNSNVGLRLKRLPKSIVEELFENQDKFTTESQQSLQNLSENLSGVNLDISSTKLMDYYNGNNQQLGE